MISLTSQQLALIRPLWTSSHFESARERVPYERHADLDRIIRETKTGDASVSRETALAALTFLRAAQGKIVDRRQRQSVRDLTVRLDEMGLDRLPAVRYAAGVPSTGSISTLARGEIPPLPERWAKYLGAAEGRERGVLKKVIWKKSAQEVREALTVWIKLKEGKMLVAEDQRSLTGLYIGSLGTLYRIADEWGFPSPQELADHLGMDFDFEFVKRRSVELQRAAGFAIGFPKIVQLSREGNLERVKAIGEIGEILRREVETALVRGSFGETRPPNERETGLLRDGGIEVTADTLVPGGTDLVRTWANSILDGYFYSHMGSDLLYEMAGALASAMGLSIDQLYRDRHQPVAGQQLFSEQLYQRITASGPLRFDEYWNLVLFSGEFGWYTTSAADHIVGSEAEVERGRARPAFRTFADEPAMALAQAISLRDHFLERGGRERFGDEGGYRVAGQGAGQGILEYNILAFLRALARLERGEDLDSLLPHGLSAEGQSELMALAQTGEGHWNELWDALRWEIVEISPTLQEAQRGRLRPFRDKVKFSLGSAITYRFEQSPHYVVTNELPDAFAVRLIRHLNGVDREIYVTVKDGMLQEELRELSPEVRAHLERFPEQLTEREMRVVNLNALAWLQNLADQMEDGAVIDTFDYSVSFGKEGKVHYPSWNRIRGYSESTSSLESVLVFITRKVPAFGLSDAFKTVESLGLVRGAYTSYAYNPLGGALALHDWTTDIAFEELKSVPGLEVVRHEPQVDSCHAILERHGVRGLRFSSDDSYSSAQRLVQRVKRAA